MASLRSLNLLLGSNPIGFATLEAVASNPPGRDLIVRKLACLLFCIAFAPVGRGQSPSSWSANPSTTPVTIQVDLSRSVGALEPVTNWFGFDESNYASMPYGQQLLRELHDLSPAPIYIRSHHLLTTGDGVPELKWSSSNVFRIGPDGKPVYDFTITD